MPTVSFIITDLHRGGAPLLLLSLLPQLAARFQNQVKFEVVSIAPRGEIAVLLQKAGIKVLSLEARSSRDLAVIPRLAEYLRMRRPAVVFSVLVHANLLVALTRPLVTHPFYWIQSIHTVQEKPAWHWWAQGLIGNLPDATVAPSRAILQKLQAYGPVPRPIVIPNGILISKFRDALPMSPVPWPAGAKVIGYVGRFDPVKRIPLLIEAMNHLPDDFHLALVGYGNEEGRLRKLAASVRNGSRRIHFVGGTASPERWYKTFDLFCLVSDAEGFALAALEAAASGVQVLVCSTPALRETLPNVAWMPRDASARQVATALLTCVNTPETRAKPALDERFGVGMMVGRYGELIGNLLPGGRKHTNRM